MSLSQSNILDLAAAVRPRLSLQDAIIVVAMISAATLFALEYDFFHYAERMTIEERRITAEEYFALTGLLIVSLIGFSFYRLRQQKREYRMRVAAEMAAREAMHEAMHDSLTGLPNRRALLLAMDTALNDPSAVPRSHALILLDLNGFKGINDTHGHPAGDQILKVVAQRLNDGAGEAMYPARLGGDEFAVWCPDILHRGVARDLAQRLVSSIAEPAQGGDLTLQVGTAAGLSFYPQDGFTVSDLFRCADAALYRAKATRQPVLEYQRDFLTSATASARRAHRE